MTIDTRRGFAPIFIVIIVAALIAAGGFAYFTAKKQPSPPPAPLPLPPPPLAQNSAPINGSAASTDLSIVPEVPPLFPGLTWNAVVKEQIVFRTKANALITQEGSRVDAKPVPACPADFLGYYRNELSKSGWKETWSADGGGCAFPYGENFGYEKGGIYFQFGVIQRNGQYISFVEYSSVNDSTGWQTYRNEKYGFEVKYPGDWQLAFNGQSIHFRSPSYLQAEIKNDECFKQKQGLCNAEFPAYSASLDINDKFASLDGYLQKLASGCKENLEKISPVSGQTAASFYTCDFGSPLIIAWSGHNKLYTVEMPFHQSRTSKDYIAILKILSTLKFTK